MNRIRDLREDLDLRQIDVARATGIDQKTLSNYETGKTLPDAGALIRLADFFHVSIDYLVGREGYCFSNQKQVAAQLMKIRNELRDVQMYLENSSTPTYGD